MITFTIFSNVFFDGPILISSFSLSDDGSDDEESDDETSAVLLFFLLLFFLTDLIFMADISPADILYNILWLVLSVLFQVGSLNSCIYYYNI